MGEMVNLTMRLATVAVLIALAASHGRDDGASASVDNADVYAILRPDLSDPINALEHQVNQQLAQDEAKVERSMPKKLTNADTALDKATDAATVVVSRQEAQIHKELMTHVSPHAVELGDPTPTIDAKAEAAKMRADVMKSIDPSLAASDLPRSKTPSKASFSGMKQMIDAAMDGTQNIHDMGESFDSKDELGDGIETYVHAKRDDRAKTRAAVSKQLGAVTAKLAKLQSSLHVNELIETAEEAESSEYADAGAPCSAEDKAAKKEECHSPKIKEKDKSAYLLPKKVNAPLAPKGKAALSAVLAGSNATKNPFVKIQGNGTVPSNISQAAVDKEVSIIYNTTLTKEEEHGALPKEMKGVAPPPRMDSGPAPVSGPAPNPSQNASNIEKPINASVANIAPSNSTDASAQLVHLLD